MAISDVALNGDRLETLRAIRDRLATDMDSGQPGVTAQLAAQLRATLSEIAELEKGTVRSPLDELAQKRKDRLAEAGIPEPARRQARGTR